MEAWQSTPFRNSTRMRTGYILPVWSYNNTRTLARSENFGNNSAQWVLRSHSRPICLAVVEKNLGQEFHIFLVRTASANAMLFEDEELKMVRLRASCGLLRHRRIILYKCTHANVNTALNTIDRMYWRPSSQITVIRICQPSTFVIEDSSKKIGTHRRGWSRKTFQKTLSVKRLWATEDRTNDREYYAQAREKFQTTLRGFW